MKADTGQTSTGGVALINLLLPGFYAWLSTVMPLGFAPDASWPARAAAIVAVLALLGGALWAPRFAGLGRWLGVYGFLGSSLCCWIFSRRELQVAHFEPSRAALGAAGFMLFALGWGTVRRRDHVPEHDPQVIPGRAPAPHARASRVGRVIFAILVLIAFLPAVLAWRVARQDQAIFAHVVGFTAAILVISTAANVVISFGKWQPDGTPGARLGRASTALTLLGVLAALAMVLDFLR